jgi:hypothetical protein
MRPRVDARTEDGVDEQQQPAAAETAGEDQSRDISQAPAAPKDDLKAFLEAGGTFGMAVRDGLAQAQLSGEGAAQMSSDHLANLLYGVGTVELHTAPYSGRAYPNPRDYNDTSRR